MGKKDVKKAIDAISGSVSGYRVKNGVVYAHPVYDFLRGFAVSSPRPGECYIDVFFQPLFIPYPYVVLSAGYRLRDSSGRQLGYTDSEDFPLEVERAVHRDALPFLELLNGKSNKLAFIKWAKTRDPSLHVEEVAACYASQGEIVEAERLWETIISPPRPAVLPWQIENQNRVRELRKAFREGVDIGNAKLDMWARETRVHLKID